MTDKFKPVPNVPKTYEQFVLEEQQLTPEQGQSLYPELEHKDIQEQRGCGPCSYYGCNHKNVPFDVDISIEGCKWWARNPGNGASLPGYWQQSPTSSYYWRENLWLNHVGHAQDADSLISRNHLYTVNTVGLYAMEDYDFCVGTQNLIRECVRLHEQGYGITLQKINFRFITLFYSKILNMTDKQLVPCGLCPNEFLLDLNNSARHIAKKKGKDIWVCPECRKIFVGEG